MQNLTITGPVGGLEARLNVPQNSAEPPTHIAILCHPHPLYGGSMDDMVLGVLAQSLESTGVATVRFNFRGVGASAGSHDGDGGEVEDLQAAVAWVAESYPQARLTLGGYSFGASTVCRLLAGSAPETLDRVLLVAPPVGNLPAPPPTGGIPTHVFAGDADAYVDQSVLATWTDAQVHLLAGADHFFGGRWQDLAAEIGSALQTAPDV